MPVVGNNLILTPIWINTWKIINNIEPIKISLLQLFFSNGIFLNTLNTRSKKISQQSIRKAEKEAQEEISSSDDEPNEPNKPNIVSKGTIKISDPEPTSPAKTPVTRPVNVNPKILFINIILEIFLTENVKCSKYKTREIIQFYC